MAKDVHERLARSRFAVVLAAALAAGHVAAGCTCAGKGDALAGVKQDIRESLGRALGLEVQSITCPERHDPAQALECLVAVRGQDAFIVEISGQESGDAGVPRWKLRGHGNIEYQLALGMLEQVRNRPERVVCPEAGDLAQGFECQVRLPGGIDTAVAITAGGRGDHSFVWVARSVLMPGAIEARVASDLAAEGKQATVSCGSEVRRIVPGSSFECAVSYREGDRGVAEVSVIDDQGHVQYRLRGSEQRGASAGASP